MCNFIDVLDVKCSQKIASYTQGTFGAHKEHKSNILPTPNSGWVKEFSFPEF
jgi:hypothetical protein